MSLDEILALTVEIARKELAPRADEVDKTGKWPEKQVRALKKAGLGGLLIPARLDHGFAINLLAVLL